MGHHLGKDARSMGQSKFKELGKIRVHFHMMVCAVRINSAAQGGTLKQSATLTLQGLRAELPRAAQVAVYVAPVPISPK